MITQKEIRKLLYYDSVEGNLFWKVNRCRSAKSGMIAGGVDHDGYRYIKVSGTRYSAHRLIWLYHYGSFPENETDHINRIKDDNRIENLRDVSRMCNMRNSNVYSNNKTGVKGVYWHKTKERWGVTVRIMNKDYHVGYFDDFDESVLTRLAVEQCLDWNGCDSSSSAYKYATKHKLIAQHPCRRAVTWRFNGKPEQRSLF